MPLLGNWQELCYSDSCIRIERFLDKHIDGNGNGETTPVDREVAVMVERAARVAAHARSHTVTGLYVNLCFVCDDAPCKGGVLNLSEWNPKSVFAITGEWEFYWDRL